MDSDVAIVASGHAILVVTETCAMNALEMKFFLLIFSDSRKRESKMFHQREKSIMKKAVGVRRLKASERNERSEWSDGFKSHPPHHIRVKLYMAS